MGSTGVQHHDRGAAAVEFALVSVLLFTLLFAIIQYGFLFFQFQAAAATAHEGARLAALGIDECPDFGRAVRDRGTANGLPAGAVTEVHVSYSDPNDPSVFDADRGVTALVRVVWTPTSFGVPFVPYPRGPLTSQAATTVEAVGAVTTACDFQ